MKTLIYKALFLSLFLLGFAGCTITTEGVQTYEIATEEIFPPSKAVASYRQLAKPRKMTDAEIESQLGGPTKFSIMKKWHALNAMAADYGIPGRPVVARISISEIESKNNAYGAYTNLRPGLLVEANYVKLGVSGTVYEDRLLFVQDRYLICVRDLSGAQDPERRTRLINFARICSDRIPRDVTDPKMVAVLPWENRVPATERLDKEDPLGLGFLKSGGVTALYRVEDRECKVFIAEAPDRSQVGGIFKQVKKAMEAEGEIKSLNLADEAVQGTLFKSTALAARRELTVFGCYGTMKESEMRELIAGIDRRVKPYVAPKITDREKERELDGPETRGKAK